MELAMLLFFTPNAMQQSTELASSSPVFANNYGITKGTYSFAPSHFFHFHLANTGYPVGS